MRHGRLPFPLRQNCSEKSDDVDFYQGVFGKTGCLNGRACRGGRREVPSVDLIHGREVVHILEEYRGFYNVPPGDPGCFKNGLDIFQHALSLLANTQPAEPAPTMT